MDSHSLLGARLHVVLSGEHYVCLQAATFTNTMCFSMDNTSLKQKKNDLLYTASYIVVLCGHMIAESVCALIHLLAYCPATECTHYVNHANNAIKGFRMYGYQLYSHTLCLPAAPHAQSTILFVCVSGPVD